MPTLEQVSSLSPDSNISGDDANSTMKPSSYVPTSLPSKSLAVEDTNDDVASNDSSSAGLLPEPQKPASNFASRLSETSSSASSTKIPKLVVVEGALPLVQKLDDAINRANASRQKKRKAETAYELISSTTAMANSSATKEDDSNNPVKTRKSWQQRAKETDWNSTKSIVENFPPYTDKSKGYGKLVPPLYMLSGLDCVLLKAHAVSRWNRFTREEQLLIKKQFAEMKKDDEEQEKARQKVVKAKRSAALKVEQDRKRNERKKAKRAADKAAQAMLALNISNSAHSYNLVGG